MNRIFVLWLAFVLFLAGFGARDVSAQKKIEKKAAVGAKVEWRGLWSVPSRFTGSHLTINAVLGEKFKFDLQAYNGANEGAISGTATVKGAKAFFDDRNSTEKDAEKRGCRLTFTHKGEFIDVEETSECAFYKGNAVAFAGEYYQRAMVVKESDFVVLGVFPNKTVDAGFKKLVGDDYEKFLGAFHLINEDENLDAFGAKVFSACVRGVCPWNAGIIMFDETGKFWAARIDADTTDKAFVNYYSNAPEWTDKLPKTIEGWLNEKKKMNENVEIIYKSKG
jgi:hypothetical protein